MVIGNKNFDDKKAIIMGILNITPDSFSDGGSYKSIDDILFRTESMIYEGADIIDIGAESTRPGATFVSADEEIERLSHIVETIKKCFDVLVSVDTYKGKVAEYVCNEGCDIINDIWGLKYEDDKLMAKVAAKYDSSICIMHNRRDNNYNSFTEDVILDLEESLQIADIAGIKSEKIILDPGVGFAKDYRQNLLIIKEIDKIVDMGYPVLLGTSRKSVIAKTLDLPVNERVEGTIATNVYGYTKGCRIFRVHDVKENARALKMTQAIINI